jgi:beta-carotene 3-hydroxylase
MGRAPPTRRDAEEPVIAALVVVVSFAATELLSYALHRWVMHGIGIGWHRSHHRVGTRGWERNDRFPLVMATLAITLFALGGGPGSMLFWSALGLTAYGVVYLLVHDVYIHQRLPVRLPRLSALEWLRRAHGQHHERGGEPYGMLAPWRRESSATAMRSSRPRL